MPASRQPFCLSRTWGAAGSHSSLRPGCCHAGPSCCSPATITQSCRRLAADSTRTLVLGKKWTGVARGTIPSEESTAPFFTARPLLTSDPLPPAPSLPRCCKAPLRPVVVVAGPSRGPGVRGHDGCAEGLGAMQEGGQRAAEPGAGLSALRSMWALLLVPGQCLGSSARLHQSLGAQRPHWEEVSCSAPEVTWCGGLWLQGSLFSASRAQMAPS